jgi:protease I
MAEELKGLKIAILVANGFEQVEMTLPRKALEKAGAQVELVSPEKNTVKGWNHREWGDQFPVEVQLDHANADDYDALMLPGGVMNPDRLRLRPEAIAFIKEFVKAEKPIAAICHAPWTLIDAGAVRGRRMTSWPSVKTDLENAGARWVDQEVVHDGQIVTSRKPDDIPAFNDIMIEVFAASLQRAKGTFVG